MEKVANSWWMYLLGVIVVIFVLAGSLFFILKSFKDAKKLNMDS
jgi:ABC-type glycerol-3-phosphate transport system permease component